MSGWCDACAPLVEADRGLRVGGRTLVLAHLMLGITVATPGLVAWASRRPAGLDLVLFSLFAAAPQFAAALLVSKLRRAWPTFVAGGLTGFVFLVPFSLLAATRVMPLTLRLVLLCSWLLLAASLMLGVRLLLARRRLAR